MVMITLSQVTPLKQQARTRGRARLTNCYQHMCILCEKKANQSDNFTCTLVL